MNLDWEKIKKECPESFNLFCEKVLSEFGKIHVGLGFDGYYLASNDGFVLNNQFCYCDFEKFFRENGIIIEICFKAITTQGILEDNVWWYIIHVFNPKTKEYLGYICFPEKSEDNLNFCEIDETRKSAIYKAFEIMEQQK